MASNSTNASASGSTSRSEPSSNHHSRTSSGSSGAAAEPEPEPSEMPSTRTAAAAAATTYNVRDYQNPAAGAADLSLSKTSKGKTDDKGKKGGATTVVCFHCGRAAPKLMRCSQCHHAHYCGPKVSPSALGLARARLPGQVLRT